MDSPKYHCTKKSSAFHGEIRNNFSQSCDKRTHKVAFIVSALIRRRCNRTNWPVFGPCRKDRYIKILHECYNDQPSGCIWIN